MNWSKLYYTKSRHVKDYLISKKKKLLIQFQKIIYEYILALVVVVVFFWMVVGDCEWLWVVVFVYIV